MPAAAKTSDITSLGSTSDQRGAPRRPVFLAGAVQTTGGRPELCFLHDLSEEGAQIELAGLREVPSHCQLFVAHLDRSYRAELVWRHEQRIGLRFRR